MQNSFCRRSYVCRTHRGVLFCFRSSVFWSQRSAIGCFPEKDKGPEHTEGHTCLQIRQARHEYFMRLLRTWMLGILLFPFLRHELCAAMCFETSHSHLCGMKTAESFAFTNVCFAKCTSAAPGRNRKTTTSSRFQAGEGTVSSAAAP